MIKRPVSITLLAVLLIATGFLGLVYHARDINLQHPLQNDTLWVELIRVLAIVAGIFMLRGHNWARWLAVAWMAFHVAISFGHPLQELIVHSILLVLFAYGLFRADARPFFNSRSPAA